MRHPALFAVLLVFSAMCVAANCGAQQANPPKTNGASSDSASDSSGRTPMTSRQIAEMHAQILMARKDYAEAAIAYQELLESDPRNPDLLTTTGMAYEQLGKYDLAEHFYKSAIKTDKNFSHALNNLGTLEYSKKRYKQAITYYKKALVAGKDMAPIYTNLGYAYCSIKQYPLAMNAFSRAIAIDPTVLDQRGAGGTLGQQRTAANPGALNFYLGEVVREGGRCRACRPIPEACPRRRLQKFPCGGKGFPTSSR